MMQFRLSPTIKVLLGICFLTFLIQQTTDQFFDGHLLQYLGLVPSGFVLEHRFWQLFTFPFLHGDVMHLFLNMLMLAFVGTDMELFWGRKKFLGFFFFCSAFAGIVYLVLQMYVWGGDALSRPMVGASASLFGLLMAYGIYFGERSMLFMMVFPMKAKHFIWILATIELMTTVFSGRAGLSSAAHLAGMVAGLGFIWVDRKVKFQGKWKNWSGMGGKGAVKRPARKANHLKLVKDSNDDDRDSGPKTWH